MSFLLECWNCHKKVDSSDLVEAQYDGYDMFVCTSCKKEFEELKGDAPKKLV